jgi:hypothetical protein
MFRKITISLAALASIGAAAFALSTTSASADYRHHHWRPAFRHIVPSFSYGSCYVGRVVYTQFGPRRYWVNVCY